MTRGDNKENLLFTCDLCMSLFMTRFVNYFGYTHVQNNLVVIKLVPLLPPLIWL